MRRKKKPLNKSDILYHLLKGWRVIILCILIGLVTGVSIIGIGYVRGEMSKEYRITSSVAIVALNQNDQFTSQSSNPYKSDVEIARNITEDALYIIKSRHCMQKVVDSMEIKGVSAGSISSNLSLSRYGDTEIIELTLLWRSEKEGVEIMRTINSVSDSVILEALKIGRVSVINEPKASFIVGGNISISTWIYAALMGAVAGVLICLIKFIAAATVINGSDLEDVFKLDLLAILPYDEEYAKAKGPISDDLPIRDDIKSLAHMLINRAGLSKTNRFYITSTDHGEGRTGLIANVAVHLSELGKRTLLVDCDLKNPVLGTMFYSELKYEQTLNALYRGDSDKLDAVLHVNGCLDLLPVILEKVPENFNDEMLSAISGVSEGYDFVLIDAAPVGVDAEVLRLNEITDAVLFVVRCDYSTVDNVKKALLRLNKSGIAIIGGVFNASNGWKDALKKAKKQMDDLEGEVKKKGKKEKKAKKKNKPTDEA